MKQYEKYGVTAEEKLFSLVAAIISCNDSNNDCINRCCKDHHNELATILNGIEVEKLKYLLKPGEREYIVQKYIYRKTLMILMANKVININPVINQYRRAYKFAYSCALKDTEIDYEAFSLRYAQQNKYALSEEINSNIISYIFFSYMVAGKPLNDKSIAFLGKMDDQLAISMKNENAIKYANISSNDKKVLKKKLDDLNEIILLKNLYLNEDLHNILKEYMDPKNVQATQLLYDLTRIDINKIGFQLSEEEMIILLYSYYIKHDKKFEEPDGQLIVWMYYNMQIYSLLKAHAIDSKLISDYTSLNYKS